MNDIHSITLESTETGYTLVVEADFGSVTGALNDLAVMRQLIVAAKHAQSYIDSHDEARDAYSAWARATRAAPRRTQMKKYIDADIVAEVKTSIELHIEEDATQEEIRKEAWLSLTRALDGTYVDLEQLHEVTLTGEFS